MANTKAKYDFSNDEIIKVVTSLGSGQPLTDSHNNLIFQTVCHNHEGGSYKLYFYPDSGLFHCYTACGDSFNVYELVARNQGYELPKEFYKCVNYVYSVLGIDKRKGFIKTTTLSDDWSIFKKYLTAKPESDSIVLDTCSPNILGLFSQIYPNEWLQEGISKSAMDKYNIRFDVSNNKIIIPHYDLGGNLIGIRGRALDKYEVDNGRKYMPICIETQWYNHPTAYNLYGLYQNLNAITSLKKIIIFEAEKSVLKCETFYGDNNFSVAVCGSNISNYQRDLILSLGVKEVFIALDKEYHESFSPESDDYSEKILHICEKFSPYFCTYVLWDIDNLLQYKDSPCDEGQKTLETLMKNKFEVKTIEESEN